MNKPWHIAIPRKIAPSAKPYWDLVRLHGGSRKKAIDFICSIGEYTSREWRYPFEFNVKAYPNFDHDHLYALAKADFSFVLDDARTDAEKGQILQLFQRECADMGPHLWERAQEDVWRQTVEDEGTFWGETVKRKLGLVGRGGGHLVIESTDYYELRGMYSDDLREKLEEREGGPNTPYFHCTEGVVELFMLCVQYTVDTSGKKVEEAFENAASWAVWSNVEAEYEDTITKYRKREHLAEAAREIHEMLHAEGEHQEAFLDICELAGITPPPF